MKFSRTLFVSALLISALTARPTAAFLDTPKPLRAGIVDWQFDELEQAWEALKKDDYLSGSVVRKGGEDVNVPVGCKAKTCAHIEFTDPLPVKIPALSVDGKIWEQGLKHLVPGGFGPLAVVNGGLEPTGRMVVNVQGLDDEAEFKVVVVKFNQATGQITLQAFFRACIRKPFSKKWLTCTPFFIPSPIFWQVKETQIMPIDINTTIKPIKLPQSVKTDIKNTLKTSLKNAAINQGLSAAGAFADSGSGGGSGSGSGGSSCQTSYGHMAHKEADPSSLVAVGGEELHQDAANAWSKMQQSALNSGIRLDVVSGYRSVSDQTDLWNKQVQRQGSASAAAKISAPPGYSEHHTGYALDIGANGVANLSAGFENTPAYDWLSKNAKSFGFEQSFTRTSAVGADNEPWHWRYTGTATAKAEFSTSGCSYGGGNGGGVSSSSGGGFNPSNGAGVSTSGYQGSFTGRTMSPVNVPINSNWGKRLHPIQGVYKHHDGVDFPVPIGTPVKAIASGKIFYQGWVAGYGNTLVIDHGSGYMSLYAHLKDGGFIGNVGSNVQMGAVVALSGSTGNSTGPHLHLTVVKGFDGRSIQSGVDIDPRSFIRF
jgi:murein DD-endopeptidase MepM/ murein hydrolase activator NlpD